MASLASGDPSEVFASKRQRIGDGRAFVTTQQGHAEDERDGQCFSSDTTAKGSESCVDVEEESSKVASSSCSWDAAVKAELERYAKSMPRATRTEDAYRPVYKRSGPPATGGMKRPFAAIALLWRRGAAPPGNLVSFVQAWSFGSCALPPGSKNVFCRRRGNLQQVQPGQITHPQSHTLATDAIVIPNAHLVQGVVDENGIQIPIRPTDNDMTIDLGEIRGFFDDKLPP
ncbi:MAG: hypothetical protein SGARI_004519 [Bacillariaceae sp.]